MNHRTRRALLNSFLAALIELVSTRPAIQDQGVLHLVQLSQDAEQGRASWKTRPDPHGRLADLRGHLRGQRGFGHPLCACPADPFGSIFPKRKVIFHFRRALHEEDVPLVARSPWKSGRPHAESQVTNGRNEPLAIEKNGLAEVGFTGSVKEEPRREDHPAGGEDSPYLTEIVLGLSPR